MDSIGNFLGLSGPDGTRPVLLSKYRPMLVAGGAALIAMLALVVWWVMADSAPPHPDRAAAISQRYTTNCGLQPTIAVMQNGLATFDYQPAGSVRAAADAATVVVHGRIDTIERRDANGRWYTELSVSDVRDHTGQERTDIRTIAYPSRYAEGDLRDPLRPELDLGLVDFVAFLTPYSGVRGGWNPGPEGLYIACDGQGTNPVLASAAGPETASSMASTTFSKPRPAVSSAARCA